MGEPVRLELTDDEALVLFEFLARFEHKGTLSIDDAAEEQVLWNLLCLLERVLVVPLSSDYKSQLGFARLRISLGGMDAGAGSEGHTEHVAVDLVRQAEVVCEILPGADVRTDQRDMLRVHCGRWLGVVRPLSDGGFEWSVTDLTTEGDLPCVTAPPEVRETCNDQFVAASSLARELQRRPGT